MAVKPSQKRPGPGRPKAEIDWEHVGKMLEAGATAEGVAKAIGIARNVLYERCQTDNNLNFSTFLQQKKATGDETLRTKQFQLAAEGDRTMLIWLGKNRLGQSDKAEVTQPNDAELKSLRDGLKLLAGRMGTTYEYELKMMLELYPTKIRPDLRNRLESELVN